jgi:hypothetical protein
LVIAPSIDCQNQSIPFNSSYSARPFRHSFKNTPALVHAWNRKWAVELEQIPVAFNAFH